MDMDLFSSNEEYNEFVQELKTTILFAQARAAFAVNRELIFLYWNIGKEIIQRQERNGWGAHH